MKVLIVEDEHTAVQKLEDLLKQIDPEIHVVARLNSVYDTITWIRNNEKPDLGFFDIQLSDDNSFGIFESCQVDFPIVFVTAYDDYLLKAFEVNSIHYLLKPVNDQKLRKALDKLTQLDNHFMSQKIKALLSDNSKPTTTTRIIARKGMDYIPLNVDEIAYFFTEHKLSFARNKEGLLYTVDQTLMELEDQLDRNRFFRANRQYLIHINAIVKFRSSDNGKLEIEVNPATNEKVSVAKERAKAFRSWVNQF